MRTPLNKLEKLLLGTAVVLAITIFILQILKTL